ncbi:hypothetical protein ACCUM_4481 [Candidatus Accumulibacter phosphatis]|uniref:Uncharacterized protein n=1 Tax=Candidatus Accumulibacter phosphatis TaxID=327160 RepID=A0A5S4ELR2_9PROT|nr:hypothetical protein ACCUM_4481 [Candidatus Accumulibacter phosphatis]
MSDVSYCKCKKDLELIKDGFIVLPKKESVVQSWLKDFE